MTVSGINKMSTSRIAQFPSLNIATYNILSPFYAQKWKTPEGVDDSGKSNWEVRWEKIQQIFRTVADVVGAEIPPEDVDVGSTNEVFDVIFLQEVDPEVWPEIEEFFSGATAAGGAEKRYDCHFARHPARRDGVAILVRTQVAKELGMCTIKTELYQANVANLTVCWRKLALVCTHQRGGRADQALHLRQLVLDLAGNDRMVIVAGDFNEDFSGDLEKSPAGAVLCGFGGSEESEKSVVEQGKPSFFPMVTLPRTANEDHVAAGGGESAQLLVPTYTRAGTGDSGDLDVKIDWIFVYRPGATSSAVLEELVWTTEKQEMILDRPYWLSKRVVESGKGPMPSDHSMEAFRLQMIIWE